MRPSSIVSTPSSVTAPALKCDSTSPAAFSTTMWLFSCSVTAISPAGETSTNSGSGSSGAMSARPVRSTLIRPSQFIAPSTIGTMATWPGGICPTRPSPASSSRSFSTATVTNDPSGATAVESGWPPRSQSATASPVARSMCRRCPDGLVKLSLVLIPTKTVLPRAETAVGSPSRAMLPMGCGFAGSEMSIIPITPSGLSE